MDRVYNITYIVFYRSTLVRYDLSAFYMSLLMFDMFICILIHLFEHLNVIALFKLNIIIVIHCYYYYRYYLCAVCGQLFTILKCVVRMWSFNAQYR